MKLLTKNKACEKLKEYGIGRDIAIRLIESGQIERLPINENSYRIPDWSLEKWLKSTVKHPLNSSSEVKSTISSSQQLSTVEDYSFEKARIQRIKNKLNNMQINGSGKLLTKPRAEQLN